QGRKCSQWSHCPFILANQPGIGNAYLDISVEAEKFCLGYHRAPHVKRNPDVSSSQHERTVDYGSTIDLAVALNRTDAGNPAAGPDLRVRADEGGAFNGRRVIDFRPIAAPHTGADLGANRADQALPLKSIPHQAVKLLSIPKAIDITLIAESFLLGNQVAEHPAEQVVGVAEKGCVYHSDIERDLARIRVTERAASFAVKAKEVEVIDIGVG